MLAPKKTHSLSISNLCLIFNINIPEAGSGCATNALAGDPVHAVLRLERAI